MQKSMSVPTAAALKMGVGFPLSDNPDARQGKVLSTSLEATTGALAARECAVCARSSERHLMAACDTCRQHYHLHCLKPPLQRPPKKSKLYGWQCSECDKTSDSEPEVMEKKVPRRSRIRYSKDGAIIHEPLSPSSTPNSPPPKPKPEKVHREKSIKVATSSSENVSPIKVTIKPFEFSSDGNESSEIKIKKDKKLKKSKSKEHPSTSGGEAESPTKKLKRSFTSPALTNTPLMSITPLVADSPNDSHNENSNASTNLITAKSDNVTQNLSFSSLLNESKERDSKTIETSIENTLANLSSDIATYKANRKRRKEKHRSRYSPDLLRSPSKSHKHKRKKKTQDMENPNPPHPRITIKIKPIPKPDGSLDTQMFYVPTDSNDGPPPAVMRKLSKQHAEQAAKQTPPPVLAVVPPAVETPVPTTPRSRVGRTRTTTGGDPTTPPAALTPMTHCDVCTQPGDAANLVRCDECAKRYHFTCLEPPLNKNPKKRGYSWHCADCDPTDVEENK